MVDVVEKEMKMLFPETDVELGGQTFSIRPFSFVETRIVVKHLKEVLHILNGDLTPQALAEIYDKAFDGVVAVIAMTFKMENENVEQFDNATALKAITSIVDVNKSFFAESVAAETDKIVKLLGMGETKPPRRSPKR